MKERMNMLRMTKRKSRILAGFMAFVLVFSNIAANVQTVYAFGPAFHLGDNGEWEAAGNQGSDGSGDLLDDMGAGGSEEEKDYDFWVDIWPRTEAPEDAEEEDAAEEWTGEWEQYEYVSSGASGDESLTLGQALLLSDKYKEQYGDLDPDLPGTWEGDNDDALEVRPDGTAFVKAPGYVNVTFTYEKPEVAAAAEEAAPAAGEEEIPAVDEAAAPVTDEAEVPVTGEEAAPAVDEAEVPEADEEAAPVTDEAEVPVTDEEAAPEADEAEVPAADKEAAPEADEAEVPAVDEEAAPEADEAEVLAADEEAAPEADEAEVPAADEEGTPAADEGAAPVVDTIEEQDVPAADTIESNTPAPEEEEQVPTATDNNAAGNDTVVDTNDTITDTDNAASGDNSPADEPAVAEEAPADECLLEDGTVLEWVVKVGTTEAMTLARDTGNIIRVLAVPGRYREAYGIKYDPNGRDINYYIGLAPNGYNDYEKTWPDNTNVQRANHEAFGRKQSLNFVPGTRISNNEPVNWVVEPGVGWNGSDYTSYTSLYYNGHTGEATYCIEPSVNTHSNRLEMSPVWQSRDAYGKAEYFDDYRSYSGLSGDEISRMLARVLHFGSHEIVVGEDNEKLVYPWVDSDEGKTKLAKVIATQILMWETVVGERDGRFNHVEVPTGYDKVREGLVRYDEVNPNPIATEIDEAYNEIAGKVQTSYLESPVLDVEDGSNVSNRWELTGDGKYKLVLKDRNKSINAKYSDDYKYVIKSYIDTGSGYGQQLNVGRIGNDTIVVFADSPCDVVIEITWKEYNDIIVHSTDSINGYAAMDGTQDIAELDAGTDYVSALRLKNDDTVGFPLSVQKTVTGMTRPSDKTFTFKLEEAATNPHNGATLPAETEVSLTFAKGDEAPIDETVSFGRIVFNREGTYDFYIRELPGKADDGYVYDRTAWTVRAKVSRGTDGKLSRPTVEYYKDGDLTSVSASGTVTFTNKYKATEISYTPEVSKVLTVSGKAKIPSNKMFTFTLTDNNNNEIQSVSVHEGTGTFDPITYTEAGTYTYTIKETSTANPGAPGEVGYTYDDNIWTLTVVVEDKGGHLEVTSNKYKPTKLLTNTDVAVVESDKAASFINKRDLAQVKLVKEGPNGEKLADAQFELYQSSDNEVGNDTKIKDLITDANGEWTSESAGLELDPKCYYYFKETQAPSHYKKGTQEYFWANSDTAGVRTATVENQYLTGSLSIKKIVDGYYESGKTFTFDIVLTLPENVALQAANGIKVTDAAHRTETSIETQTSRTFTVKVTVAKDGTATLTGIPYGTTYTVTEETVSVTHDGVTQNYTGGIKEGQSSSGTIEAATVGQEWTNTLYFDAAVTLTAKKTVAKIDETGSVTTLDPTESNEEFEFQLLDMNRDVLGTAKVKHNESAVFSTSENTNSDEELHYTKDEAGPSVSDPVTYWYCIREKLTDAQTEVYSAQNDIWVEVKVYMGTGDETGVVKTVKTYHDGAKTGAEIAQDAAGGVGFVNYKYVANLKATKKIYTVTNNEPGDNLTGESAETFTFNLYSADEFGEKESDTAIDTRTVSAVNWTANFDPINYTQDDAGKTYWYLIEEEDPEDKEYTVGAPLLVSVELKNEGGILRPTVTYYHKLDNGKSEKLDPGAEVITNTKYKIKLEVGKLFETLLDNELISTAPDSDKEFTVTMKHYTPGTGADDTPAPITQTFKAGNWQATFEPDKVYTVEGAEPVVDWYVIEEQLGDNGNSAFYTASNKVYAKVTLTKADSKISTDIKYYSDPKETNEIAAITNTKYEVKLEAGKSFYTRNNEVTTRDNLSLHEKETFKFYLSRWDDENEKWLDWYSAATNQWSAEEEADSTKVCDTVDGDTVDGKDWKAEFTDQLLYTDENDLGGKTEVSYWYKIEEELEENTGLYVSSGPVYAKVTVEKNEEKGIVKLTTSKEYFNKFKDGQGFDSIGETVPVIRNTKNTFDLNLEKKFADVTIDVKGFSRVDADYPSDESFAFDIYEPVQEKGKWNWSKLPEKRIVLQNDGNDENDNEWFGKFPIDYTETGIYWYKLEEDRGLSYDGKDYTSVPVYVRVKVTDGNPETENGAESFANEPGDGQFDISVEYFKGYTVSPEAAGSNPFTEDPFEGVAFPADEKAENKALYYNIKYYINFNVTKSVVRTDDNSDPVNVTDQNDETFTLYLSEWAGDGWQSRTSLYDGDGTKNEVAVHGTDSWSAEFTENYSNKPVGDYWYKIDEKLTDDSKYVKSPVYVHVNVARESDILTATIDYYRDLQFDADGKPEEGITPVDPSGVIPFVNTDNEAHLELYKQIGSVDNDGGIAEDKMSDHAGEKFTFRLDQWDSGNKELWIPIGKTDASDATDWKASFELNYTKTGTYWYRISEELTPEQRKDYVSNLVFAKVVVTDEDPRTEGRDEEKVYGKLYTEITYYRTVSQGMQAEVDDDGKIVTRMGVSGGTPFEDNKPVCYNLRNTATFEFYKEVDRYTDNEGPEDVTDTKGAEVYTFRLSEWGTDGWTDVNAANAEATLATDWKAVFTLNYAEKPSGTYWYKISEVLDGDTIYMPDPVYVRTDHQKLNGNVSTKVTYFKDFNEETGKGENPFADGEKITFMNTENIVSLNLLKKVTMVTDGGPEEDIYPEEGFEFELFEGTVNAAGEEEWKSLGTTVADDASEWRARFELNYVADDCGDQETDSRTYWYKLVENLKGDQTKNFVQDGDIYASVEVTRNKLDVKTDVTYYQEIKVGDNGQFEGVATFGTDGKVEPTYKNVMYRVTLKPDVIKTVIGYDGQALEKPDATFTFQLYEKVGGDYVLLRSAQNDADGKVDFEPLVYTGADEGTHTYRMLEVAEGGDYRYDTTVYDFTVEVGPSHSSELQAVPSYEMGRPFEFTNDKIFTEEDQWTPRATKTLNGQLAGADGFTFELKDEAGNVISTATSAGNGSVTFDTITYGEGEDGVHTYTMNERVGSSSLIIYDAKVYTVTVTVEKTAAGNRVASVAYTLDGAAVTDVLFENQTRSTTSTTPNRTGTTIPDNEVPQGPGTPEIITISDEPTPLSDFETIEDEDVPLAFLAPMTGDNRPVGAAALFGLLALGMMGAFGILASKKDEEDA